MELISSFQETRLHSRLVPGAAAPLAPREDGLRKLYAGESIAIHVSRPSCRVPSSHGARLVNTVIVGDVARNHYFALEFVPSRLPSFVIWLDVVSRSY